jgi:ureidoacrylate peracid hydrolase
LIGTAGWQRGGKGGNVRRMQEGTAVVVVDMQNDYCHPDGVFFRAGLQLVGLEQLVESVNTLTAAARAARAPVFWVAMVWDGPDDLGLLRERSPFLAAEGLRRGTWGAELVDELTVVPDDHRVEKKRFSAFFESDLDRTLRAADISRLVVAGVRTDFCVESTVRDAFFRDYDVVVVRDAVAGYLPDLHDSSLRLMDTVFGRVVDLDTALAVLEERRPVAPTTPGM